MVKKQLIMDKALELFAENGIEATSVQQITERCGISKGAFYLSYKSKKELIFDLIEHFIGQIISDIEQSVNSEKNNDELLYHFYHTIFTDQQKYADFAKIFLKEQLPSFDIEILELLRKYDQFTTAILFSLVDRQFPELNNNMRADLVFNIKGFIKHYAELFLIYHYPVNLDLLCESLVEKTKILAKYATIPIVTEEILNDGNLMTCLSPAKEQLIEMLSQKISESTDSITKQSLELLLSNLKEPHLPPAVIQGLLKNLRSNAHCKWTAYLYELYVK